jgi:hypothetical protein
MELKHTVYFLFLLFPILANAKDVIRLGYLEYPPSVYSESENVPKGPVIDFIEQHLDPHFEIKWSKIPIGRVRWAFENQVIDAYPFLIHTKEREEWVHYFKKPYVTIQNVICSKKGIAKPAESLSSLADDLAGSILVFPLNNASSNYPFLSDTRVSQLKIEFTNYIERSLSLLEKGRAEYVYFPSRGPLERAGKIHLLSCKNIGNRIGLYFAVSKNNKLTPMLEDLFDSIDTWEN